MGKIPSQDTLWKYEKGKMFQRDGKILEKFSRYKKCAVFKDNWNDNLKTIKTFVWTDSSSSQWLQKFEWVISDAVAVMQTKYGFKSNFLLKLKYLRLYLKTVSGLCNSEGFKWMLRIIYRDEFGSWDSWMENNHRWAWKSSSFETMCDYTGKPTMFFLFNKY